jgi:putative Mn2+ efflux pump MntP
MFPTFYEGVMDWFSLILIALALAVDAFAVAVASGVSLCQVDGRQVFRLSFHFGLFQAGMNIIGWFAGLSVRSLIEEYDHWIAFILLAFVAGKMLLDSAKGHEEKRNRSDPTRGISLIMLSTATSIDSLAVGLGFSVLNISIWFPATVIGIVAALLTAFGMRLGCVVGNASRIGSRAEFFGGLVLLGIGLNILYQHGVFQNLLR